MSDKMNGSLLAILKGSPIAVALLLMYWMGNTFWGQRLSDMISNQSLVNERMAQAIEKISDTQVELTRTQKDALISMEKLHLLLIDHLKNGGK